MASGSSAKYRYRKEHEVNELQERKLLEKLSTIADHLEAIASLLYTGGSDRHKQLQDIRDTLILISHDKSLTQENTR